MSEVRVERGTDSDETSAGRTVAVEREVTKRALIEAITSVVLVVLYMAFSLFRDRDPGVVALDGAAEDWE